MRPEEAALVGLWLMLPALIPNTAAVIWGGGTPMDFGRNWNGRRVLGDGKTWRGFFGGALTGAAFGILEIFLIQNSASPGTWGFGRWPESIVTVFAIAFGSMIGDSAGSFIKRRLNIRRGEKAPGLDQYNFVAGALAFALLFRPQWFATHYFDGNGIFGLILLLAVVPILHRGVNIIGYKLGRKDVPW